MTMMSRRLARFFLTSTLALALVGMAGAASAQGLVCISLDHGVPAKPLLQLMPTFPGNGFVSIVGRKIHPVAGDRGVVSGGGVTINGVFEISLHESTIASGAGVGPTPILIAGSTHILLDPTTLLGTFKVLETRVLATGDTLNEHTEGAASVVVCPPGG